MLTLTYKADTKIPIEAEAITPDRLAGKSRAEIAALPVQHGNASVPLGDFFTVSGDAGDQVILVEGDCSRVKRLGSEMTSGRLTIRGDVGMHVGSEMTGGTLIVHGNAGDWAGAEMGGGLLHIHGNAGHLAGAGYRGCRHGMRGGTLLIDDNAGDEIGASMRRGFIAIGGTSGDFAGVNVIAGSLFLFGQAGHRLGAGMKRGTIALFGGAAPLLPTFALAGVDRPVFMNVFLKCLGRHGFRPALDVGRGRYRRYRGDRVSLGKGEILIWEE